MSRKAVVVANSVSYGDTSKNLPRAVVGGIAREVETRLTNLEDEFRYSVTVVEDSTRARAREQIRRVVKSAGDSDEPLLLYYFGHAVQPDDSDELYLFFKDSELYDLPTMLKFAEVAEWMDLYKVPEVVTVMDCCHAGMIARHLRLVDLYGGKFFVMASVNAKGKALVDYGEEQPIGLFTRYFLQSFGHPGARATGRDVTFSSFFRFVESKMTRTSKQQPYSVDNGLANKVFFRQSTRPVILPSVSFATPKKCIYRKLFAIASTMLKHEFRSVETLYNFLERREAPEFLQPIKREDGAVDYHFVGDVAFRSYISLSRELGILESDEPLRLTNSGKRLVRNSGSQFNVEMLGRIQNLWARYGVRLEDLEDAIGQRLKANSVPSIDGIYSDILLAKRLMLPKQMFKVLLDLTAYTGALDYAAEKTFFLSTPPEEPEIQ